jgi:uncharacterized protein
MFITSSNKSIFKVLNIFFPNKNTIIIIIIVIISMSIYYLYINEQFTNTKTINLDTYHFESEQEKKKGLMFVKNPLGNKGALFIYPLPQQICIWMKNTFIPLDGIILDKDYKIIEFIPNLKPKDLQNKCSNNTNGSYFIEVDAGFIKKNKLNIGDTIICNEIPFNLLN